MSKANKIMDTLLNFDYDGMTESELVSIETSLQNELDDVKKTLRYKRLDEFYKTKED